MTTTTRIHQGSLVRAWVAGLLAAVGVVMGVTTEDLTHRMTKPTAVTTSASSEHRSEKLIE